jgi:COX assembly protein 2
MVALEECHNRGFLWKSLGMCNNTKEELIACLRAERWKRAKHNRSDADEKKEKIRRAWKEIDENS